MIRFAALVAGGAPDSAAFAAYAAEVGAEDAALAHRLLTGQRPKRLAVGEALLAHAAHSTATPDFLIAACRSVAADAAETAALLLGPCRGTPPSLVEALDSMTDLAAWASLARRLPIPARLVLIRLAAGTFRTALKSDAPVTLGPLSFRAVLTMVSPQGPMGHFALRHGNGLVPIAQLPLTLPDTPEILGWARANVLDRFGPNISIRADLVFDIACEGFQPNARRKSGLDLVGGRLIGWARLASADQADSLDDLRARLAAP